MRAIHRLGVDCIDDATAPLARGGFEATTGIETTRICLAIAHISFSGSDQFNYGRAQAYQVTC
ncbi:hypothetical protein [Nitrosomonas ureae]|uniref:hypothetical protein n=1 Tax=Nitrosomonas ureae TaxID=44577 RepID=UPI0011B2287E|nr:hypothetical protein [Nitrosomonas ureae]